jgi:hypothetical protein
MAPAVVEAFKWAADTDEGDRHAWPQREGPGFPSRSLCDLGWNVRYGREGARYCDTCLGSLRRLLAGAQDALVEAEHVNATGDLDRLIARDAMPEGEARAMDGNR